ISSAESPVVPITWTMPASAASAAVATVAAGTVKSRMPSAFASSGLRSAVGLTPLAGRPARTPASWPSSGGPDWWTAPATTGAGGLASPGDDGAGGVGDRLTQGAPHAPAGAEDHEPHVRHGGSPGLWAGIAGHRRISNRGLGWPVSTLPLRLRRQARLLSLVT